MSTTATKEKSGTKTSSKATEKARREGIAQAQARIDKIDAGVRPGAQQVASIDVDPKVELAAAAKHAAKGKGRAKPGARTVILLPPNLAHAILNDGKPATAENIKAAEAKGRKGKATKAPKPGKPAKAVKEKKAKADKPPKAKKVSALDAAAQVLAKRDQPMTTTALIDAMAKQKLWTSPGGKTPAATLNAALIREIKMKGRESRFKKTGRGLFAAAKPGKH